MDRDQLDGRRVAVEPAGALAGDLDACSSAICSRSQVSSADEAEPLARSRPACSDWPTWRRSVSSRSPPTAAEHPGGQPVDGGRLEHRGDPALGEQLGPVARTVPATSSVSSSPPASSSTGGVPEEGGERRRRGPGRRGAAAPAPRAGAATRSRPAVCEDAAAAGDDGRARRRAARACCTASQVVRCGSDARRRRAGSSGASARTSRRTSSSRLMSRATSRDDVVADLADRRLRPRTACRASVARGPPAAGTGGAGARRAGAVVVRLDVADHDPLVAERGAAQHGLQRVEQRAVAAPVDARASAGWWRSRRPGGRSTTSPPRKA